MTAALRTRCLALAVPLATANDNEGYFWPEKDKAALIAAYQGGASIIGLAKYFDTTPGAINRALNRWGIERRLARINWTLDKAEHFNRAWLGGVSAKTMSRIFGCTENAICVRARDLGLSGSPERAAAQEKLYGYRRRALDRPKNSGPMERGEATLSSAATMESNLQPSDGQVIEMAAMSRVAPLELGDEAGAAIIYDHRYMREVRMSDAQRELVTRGWKAGHRFRRIAADADMAPGDVPRAIAALGLTNDPDRRRAMHGGGAT